MKLPSFQGIIEEGGRTLRRFPIVMLAAAIGTAAMVIIADHEGPPVPTFLFKIIFSAILALPLFAALRLEDEREHRSVPVSAGKHLLALALLAAYATTVPMDMADGPEMHMVRLFVLTVGLFLLLVVAPFARRGEMNGFWQFTMTLILRILVAGVFAAVLFGGLALALAALDNLFGFVVPPRRYFQLWCTVVGLFGTWFTLAGIPEKLEEMESRTEYPKGLQIFTQYVLLPLTVIYLVILYAYLGKIVFTGVWPEGWVSRLILGFAAAGIFALVIAYPLRNAAEHRWIKPAARWFFAAMAPLVVMLFLALGERIGEYGITEGRYIGFAFGVWLGGMTLYMLVRGGENIKSIPASLGILALLIAWGPWSMFSVSEQSQVGRLRSLLEKNALLENGRVNVSAAKVPSYDAQEISAVIEYLRAVHGYGAIQSWFAEPLKVKKADGREELKTPQDVAAILGLTYVHPGLRGGGKYITLNIDHASPISLSGYDRMVTARSISSERPRTESDTADCRIEATAAMDSLTVIVRDAEKKERSVRLGLHPFVDGLITEFGTFAPNVPAGKLSLAVEQDGLKAKVQFLHISMGREHDSVTIKSYDAHVFYSVTEGGVSGRQ